jgi:hypothetical protein
MSSYKDMAELAGYTSRVYSLLSTLHELDIGRYHRTARPADLPLDKPFYDLGHINGVVIEGVDSVDFENVPIVAPAPGLPRGGEELVKSLNVSVKPGEHLLITGPNVSASITTKLDCSLPKHQNCRESERPASQECSPSYGQLSMASCAGLYQGRSCFYHKGHT